MRKIWKFRIPPQDEPVHLMLPIGSKIVRVADKHIWIEGAFSATNKREALFYTKGTDHPIEDQLRHVGSYQDGVFIWHIYVYAGEWLVT